MTYTKWVRAATICAGLVLSSQAQASCTLVMDYSNNKTIQQNGDCQTRVSPLSTFKIPLAVMGFDSGILKDEHNPSWPYKDEYNGYSSQKITTDPTIWEAQSIVWFSQQLTRKLGMKKFQHYVDIFDYGNRNLSGDPRKNDGLTNAWLSTSLTISPAEQVQFIKRLLDKNLGVSLRAYDMTYAVMPRFQGDGGWIVYGKTGTSDDDHGWFVGWAKKDARTVIFAKWVDDRQVQGADVRDEVLRDTVKW